MLRDRYLTPNIVEDLKEKMVFVGGPRQVGKTTLCRDFVASFFKRHAYYNWDNRADRKDILKAAWPADAELLIFDELHKYKAWKNLIKGEYDKLKNKYRFIVSAVQGSIYTGAGATHSMGDTIITAFIRFHLLK